MSKVARVTLLCAIALFGAVSAWGVYSLINPQQAGHSSRTALIGGPFELTRHDGKRVSEKDFEGKYTLIFFGYTFCPDVCPAGLQVMTAALDKLGGEADQIQPVFITIDPQRDTPEVLASYIEHFHPRLIGLTGSADDIAKAAKAYRVYYAKAKGEADDDPQDYLMDHSSILYLMGPDGTFVKHFTYTTDVEKLAEAIKSALAG